jgi:hypothetical protein
MKHSAVLQGWKARWDESNCPAAVPGGLHQGRPPQPATPPYASVKVTLKDILPTSGTVRVEIYTVTVRIWFLNGAESAAEIEAALDEAYTFKQADLTVDGAQVLLVRPVAPGGIDSDEDLREGEDVLLTEATWDVHLQVGGVTAE